MVQDKALFCDWAPSTYFSVCCLNFKVAGGGNSFQATKGEKGDKECLGAVS